MPVDPSLSLQLNSARPAAPAAPVNLLSTIGSFAEIQNQLNQNRLFQQTFAARQRAGAIIAASPDMDSAIKGMLADPGVAPFAGETIKNFRDAQQTLMQIGGEQQTQAQSALGAYLKALPAALADPNQLPAMTKAQLATMSPAAQKALAPVMGDIQQALLQGLPSDPAAARQVFSQRVSGQILAGGGTPESIRALTGSPTVVETGGAKQPGVQLPPQLGGGFAPSGAALPMTLSPQIITPEVGAGGAKQPMTVGGASGANANPLSAGAGDGQPLLGPTQEQSAQSAKLGAAGGDLASDMAERAKALPTDIRRLDIMNTALQGFQAGGGASFRADLAKALQAGRNAGITAISQPTIDKVANENLADTQVFQAQVKPLVIGELKAAAQGTGRVMRSEVDAFLQMMNATTDPTALQTLLNQARNVLQVGYDQSQKFMDYKQSLAKGDPAVKGLGLSDFYSWYNRNYASNTLPEATPGGMRLGPVEGARGATGGGPAVTHRWVPGQGLVPVPSGDTPGRSTLGISSP